MIPMAKMVTCACGWTAISPQGEEDTIKHTALHLKDVHPGTAITREEMKRMIKNV